MNRKMGAPLRFVPGYMGRIWGGTRLRDSAPAGSLPDGPIGEAWLIADHPQHQSIVADGPWAGGTLHALLEEHPEDLLGRLPRTTTTQRFPLLLKLLDASQVLSVQVHPDDKEATRLGEHDGGKTEMWHVLEADEDAEVLCGFREPLSPTAFASAVKDGSIGKKLLSLPARPGLSVYVQAGTVHALGAGLLVAEIQQNSDVTYRVYDWDRKGPDGAPRQLHTNKAAQVANLDAKGIELPSSWRYTQRNSTVQILAFAPYFAAESIEVNDQYNRDLDHRSFSILLSVEGTLRVSNAAGHCDLERYSAVLLPACGGAWTVEGAGRLLHYYIADLQRDLLSPLGDASLDASLIEQELRLRGLF